jgi:3-phosphoshikimate 1-carboxyvinyltransferase
VSSILISRNPNVKGNASLLPSSKSISNRVLILNALSSNKSTIRNLSTARDTQLMQALIDSPDKVIDIMDAGTTMRFLAAYYSLTGQHKIITGSDRMKQRPIGLLVNALREIGVTIRYKEKEGFPPIETAGFSIQKSNTVRIPGDVSSQYISALMMTAPLLQDGLVIQLEGKIGSRPYIEMTAALMKDFGISCEFKGNSIQILPSKYLPATITIEADWSAASYWFAFVALAETGEVTLPHVSEQSLQGDRVAVEVMSKLGVKTLFGKNLTTLTKQPHNTSIEWDFLDCPDLAQTVLPVCAAKGIPGRFVGLESLRIKETDRIAALQTELAKIGAALEEGHSVWNLIPGHYSKTQSVTIKTYHDHRMAMGMAPLATLMDVTIESPEVVNKSYPGFWEDMKTVGFEIQGI